MFDDPTAANESMSEASPWTHVQFDTNIVSKNLCGIEQTGNSSSSCFDLCHSMGDEVF